MIGGRHLAAALTLVCALGPAGGAVAQGPAGPLPDRRITVEPGVDFYGSDLRSILRHDAADLPRRVPGGRRVHRLHLQCRGERLLPEIGRWRAHPVPRGPVRDARAAAGRARRAGRGAGGGSRLPAGRTARGGAGGGARGGLPAGEPGHRCGGRGGPRGADGRGQPDRCRRGLGGARGLCRGRGESKAWLRDLAVSAGINAFLRAGTDAEAGEAARLTGVALEAAGEGRASLDALRLAESLAPGPAIARRGGARRGALRLPGARPPGRLRGDEPARLLRLLRAPGRRRHRLRRFRPDRRRELSGRGARPAALHRRARARQPLPGDAARGAAVGRGRAAARLGRAGGLRARPHAGGALRRPRLRAAEERRRPRCRSSRSTPARRRSGSTGSGRATSRR